MHACSDSETQSSPVPMLRKSVSSRGLWAWPFPRGVVGADVGPAPGMAIGWGTDGLLDMLSCTILPSLEVVEVRADGLLVVGPLANGRFHVAPGRTLDFECVVSLAWLRALRALSSGILISRRRPSVVRGVSAGWRSCVSCDFDVRNTDGRIDKGGCTMREALPSILSIRSGRRRKSNCLKRLTARTW